MDARMWWDNLSKGMRVRCWVALGEKIPVVDRPYISHPYKHFLRATQIAIDKYYKKSVKAK